MKENRNKLLCPKCKINGVNIEMVFRKKITPPSQDYNFVGLLYRCPTRKDENGCGYEQEILLKLDTQEIW